MIEFKPPSLTAFQCRRIFHKCERKETESVHNWLTRIKDSIVDCAYDSLHDFMLIDKFISGLDETDFEYFSQRKLWPQQETLLNVKDCELNYQKDISIECTENVIVKMENTVSV